ncbi:MAG TPA: hypothetical protein VH479_00800 [Acidimicrobiales bacterium]|jgi:hypothetical protein
MTTSRRLTAVLTRTLEVKADQAMTAGTRPSAAPDEARDLSEPAPPLRVVTRREPPRRRTRALLPAAAAILVLALVSAGAIALHRGSPEEHVSTAALAEPPDGWLVPAWVPDGMELWGLEFSSWSGQDRRSEPDETIPQLFGDPDAGRAIYITSSQYEVVADTAEAVTVRGESGHAGPAWDVAESDVGQAITWDERGGTVTALYKGTTRDEAIAVLDSLDWRSDDPADGFAPPDDDAWALRAEVPGWPPASHEASFSYSQGVPSATATDGRPGLWIHTEASSQISAGFLAGWYQQGSPAGDTTRPVSNYDGDSGRLELFWADGRSIIFEPIGPSPVPQPSRDQMERIARSLTVAGEADLGALRDGVGAKLAALPVVASADTAIGRFEVHGENSFMVLCLDRPGDGPPTCPTDRLSGGSGPGGSLAADADWTVDGTWYVGMASTTDDFTILSGHDASTMPDAGELAAETTTDGEWTFYLVTPPPDIDQVCVGSRDGATVSCGFNRPVP